MFRELVAVAYGKVMVKQVKVSLQISGSSISYFCAAGIKTKRDMKVLAQR